MIDRNVERLRSRPEVENRLTYDFTYVRACGGKWRRQQQQQQLRPQQQQQQQQFNNIIIRTATIYLNNMNGIPVDIQNNSYTIIQKWWQIYDDNDDHDRYAVRIIQTYRCCSYYYIVTTISSSNNNTTTTFKGESPHHVLFTYGFWITSICNYKVYINFFPSTGSNLIISRQYRLCLLKINLEQPVGFD